MPQVPFAFEFEPPNGNSVTKQLPNYRSAVREKLVEWPKGNLAIVLSPNRHLAI